MSKKKWDESREGDLHVQSYGLNFMLDYLSILSHHCCIETDSEVHRLYDALFTRVASLLECPKGFTVGKLSVAVVLAKDE